METEPSSPAMEQSSGAAANKPGLRKPVFVEIEALKPGTTGHTLVVKVVNANTVLNKKPRNTKIAECLIGDETGTILFTAQ